VSAPVLAAGVVLRDPWLLLAALAVPAALLPRRGRAPAVRLASAALLLAPGVPRGVRARLAVAPGILEAAALVLAAVALARPAERVAAPRVVEGVDVMLCMDVSSSMTATDLAPGVPGRGRTRLDVAREAALRFVEGRPDDRVGLVAFARFPDLRCPPTLDHRALAGILASVAPVEGDGPEDATGIGGAAALAARVLASGKAPSRVAILLTDGEENVAGPGASGEIDPAHAAQLCERLGVRVHVIVAGSPRPGSSPASGPGPSRVETLARATGGVVLRAADAAAMREVYARIDALERMPFESPRTELADRFLPLLAAALGLLLAARTLRATALKVAP
jgi:Ca-activated chloride channel family protein